MLLPGAKFGRETDRMASSYKLGDPVPRRVRWITHITETPWGWTERSNYEARCTICPGCSPNFISGTRSTTAIGTQGRHQWKQLSLCKDCLPEHLRLQKNARQKRYRDSHRLKRSAFCDHCGATFAPQRSTAQFCSSACRVALIGPVSRPPCPLATILRIHLLLQWYSLSDLAMEEALIEVPTMRRFAGIALISDRIPDETTILTFRHLLEKHDLGEQIFETVKAHLSARGVTMRQGTIVDATLIAVPSSTKNKEGKRDPEMHQTKKGNQWYHRFAEGFAYGMKVHAGVDKDSGLIHSVVVTAANVHDLTPAAELLHGDD